MNPEIMQILIPALAGLFGYFLRHWNVALPGVAIPASPLPVVPAMTPTAPAAVAQPAAQANVIVQQLLQHQLELIQRIGSGNPGNAPAPAVQPLTSNAS